DDRSLGMIVYVLIPGILYRFGGSPRGLFHDRQDGSSFRTMYRRPSRGKHSTKWPSLQTYSMVDRFVIPNDVIAKSVHGKLGRNKVQNSRCYSRGEGGSLLNVKI
ncbi:hypothetical protein HAX54_023348, partial [Datura stramonium]|nr:hypothetical protein [Datura stramonium]